MTRPSALILLWTALWLPGGLSAATNDARGLVREAEEARIRVMERVAPCVVSIFGENRSGGGSGVVITPDGYGLTNFHVVAEMLKTRQGLGGLSDGKLYPLQVLGIDPTGDLAMFRLTADRSFDAPPLGDSDQLQMGDPVFAMGNPFLLAEDYTPTVTHGIVSGVHRYQFGADGRSLVYTDCIQVDASINPGNSGGPLFNMRGQLVGINGRASFEQRGRVNVGLGYAISINQVKRFIPGLRAGLLVEHGSLGATTVDLGFRRVVFEKMLEPSVAYAAGVRIGDRLADFAGREIHTSNLFGNILGVFPAGWPVPLTFEHEGKLISRTVRLERLPASMKLPFEPDPEINRAETRRVLEACRQTLGAAQAPDRIGWQARRVRMRQAGATPGAAYASIVSQETRERGQCHISPASNATVTCTYDGRALSCRFNSETPAEADAIEEARLNLWLALRRAIYCGEAPIDRWRHVGGDEWKGSVLDVLEFASTDNPEIRVSIDPVSHEPRRVTWRPTGPPSGEKPPMELELEDYRPVGGIRLPFTVRLTVYGESMIADRITSYEMPS